MSSVEQLEREADELWRQAYAPDQAEEAPADTAPAEPTQIEAEASGQAPEGQEAGARTVPVEVSWEERYKHAQANMTRATQEAAARRAENDELRRAYYTLSQQISQANTAATPATGYPAAQQDTAADGLDDDLRKAIDEDPALAGPLVRHMQKLRNDQEQISAFLLFQEQRAAFMRQQEQQRMEHERHARHDDMVRAAHPDAFDIGNSESFKSWLAGQPHAIQRIKDNGTVDDVNWLLATYKQAVGLSSNMSDARAAATPNTPRVRNQSLETRPRFTRAQIAAMPRDEFERRQAEIDAAIESGLIV